LKAKTSDLSRVGVGVWEISKLVPLGTYIKKMQLIRRRRRI
jgi:hypothetical protein